MKFTVRNEQVARATKALMGYVPGRTTMPILQNMKLEARDGAFTLEANCLERALRLPCDSAEIERDGAITVPARLFSDVVQRLGDGEIAFDGTLDNPAELRFAKGGATSTLRGELPEGVWSDMPDHDDMATCLVPAGELITALKPTLHSYARDDSRPALTGVHAAIKDGEGFRLETANGFLLTVSSWQAPGETDADIIIPGDSAAALMALIESDWVDGSEVALAITERHLTVESNGVYFASQLTAATYPETAKLLVDWGSDERSTVEVNRQALESALKVVKPLTDDNGSVRVGFGANKDGESPTMLVFARSEAGETRVEIPCAIPNAKPAKRFAMNLKYLTEMVSAADSETVALSVETDKNAIGLRRGDHVRRLNSLQRTLDMVAMPLFVQWNDPKLPFERE